MYLHLLQVTHKSLFLFQLESELDKLFEKLDDGDKTTTMEACKVSYRIDFSPPWTVFMNETTVTNQASMPLYKLMLH